MLRKTQLVAILGIAILIFGQTALAQSQESPSSKGLQKLSSSVNQIGKEVNQFGKNLVDLVLDKEQNKKTGQKSQNKQPSSEFSSERAGSAFNYHRTARNNTSSTKEAPRPSETYSPRQPYSSGEPNKIKLSN
ncbi:MAG: hypothetical protein PVH19_07690, partial [Planctomycetia bacterium]